MVVDVRVCERRKREKEREREREREREQSMVSKINYFDSGSETDTF